MRSYATVSPAFWTGDTGRQLRAMGTDVLAVALYLMTSPHSNMIGLYYLPLVALCHETGLGRNAVFAALKQIESVEFAFYDEAGEVAWVPEMARYQIGERLAEKDKKRASVLREIGQQRKGRYFSDFMARYGEAFHLPDEWNEEANKGHATRGMGDPCMPPVHVKDPDPVLDLPGVDRTTPREDPGKPKRSAMPTLPAWIPPELWEDWRAQKRALRMPMTAAGEVRQINRLTELRQQGFDPVAVINKTLECGWKSFQPLTDGSAPRRETVNRPPERDLSGLLRRPEEDPDA